MANRNTRRVRAERDNYGRKTGRAINSSELRRLSGKRPFNAPTRNER